MRRITQWRSLCVLGALFLVPWTGARAGVYSYIDEAGVITITDVRPAKRTYRVIVSDSPASAGIAKSGPGDYDHLIAWHARTFDVDPRLVKAVMMAESKGNPKAISRKGAQGLMQIMPGTARSLGLQDPFDPGENIAAGTRYLRLLYERFTGNTDLVLAAYNAGPERVVANNMSVPPINETVRYIKRVKAYYTGLTGQ